MELPRCRFPALVVRRTVPAQRIGEGDPEQGVVATEEALEDGRQPVARLVVEIGKSGEWTAWDEERLVGPRGPEGHDRQPLGILVHDTWPTRLLLGVVGEQPPLGESMVATLCRIFLGSLARDGRPSPDLAVRMRTRRAHRRAAVLEDLDPAITSPELGRLVGPDIDDLAHVLVGKRPRSRS